MAWKYTDLKAKVLDFMARNDISGNVEDFIMLGEARLNREIESIATSTPLSGTAGRNYIDISALNVLEPVSLYVDGIIHEFQVTPKPQGSFPYYDISGTPSLWCIDEDRIMFDRALDVPYTFRFTYQGRFALSSAAPTNEFLTHFPDVYLAASIVWGCLYTKDVEAGAMWKTLWDEGIASAKSTYAQSKRAQLTVDPMLNRRTRYSYNLDTAL